MIMTVNKSHQEEDQGSCPEVYAELYLWPGTNFPGGREEGMMGSGKLLDSQESGPSADRDITPKARVMSLTTRRGHGEEKAAHDRCQISATI